MPENHGRHGVVYGKLSDCGGRSLCIPCGLSPRMSRAVGFRSDLDHSGYILAGFHVCQKISQSFHVPSNL